MVAERRSVIQDIIGDAEAFLRINRDKLSTSQIEEMQQLINNLRRYLDQIWVILEQVVKETDTQIVAMQVEQEQQVRWFGYYILDPYTPCKRF